MRKLWTSTCPFDYWFDHKTVSQAATNITTSRQDVRGSFIDNYHRTHNYFLVSEFPSNLAHPSRQLADIGRDNSPFCVWFFGQGLEEGLGNSCFLKVNPPASAVANIAVALGQPVLQEGQPLVPLPILKIL